MSKTIQKLAGDFSTGVLIVAMFLTLFMIDVVNLFGFSRNFQIPVMVTSSVILMLVTIRMLFESWKSFDIDTFGWDLTYMIITALSIVGIFIPAHNKFSLLIDSIFLLISLVSFVYEITKTIREEVEKEWGFKG